MDKYNKEGYLDLTPYLALKKHYYPIIYICSPFAGDIENNIFNAKKYSRFAINKGYMPIAPHLLYPQILNDLEHRERKLRLLFGNILMDRCSEIQVFGDYISSVMRAKVKKYTISYFDINCKEINKKNRYNYEPIFTAHL